MSMNIIQKTGMIASLVGVSAFSLYLFLKPAQTKTKEQLYKVRQELLKDHDIRMLYSTMSFLYLQGFHQSQLDSFYKMKEILRISPPNIVVLETSQEDYDKKYSKVMNHPRFEELMQKFEFYLENKQSDNILAMKDDFDLENLQKLYLMYYCKKKKCKVVHGFNSEDYYKNLQSSYERMLTELGQKGKAPEEVKQEDYVDKTIEAMKPQGSFKLIPETPFKTILGLVQPVRTRPISRKWKDRFKAAYGHNILEDDQVVKREEEMAKAKAESHY